LLVNNPSPGFLIGAVGGAMMGSTAVGAALFLITWLSAMAVGIALRLLRGAVPQITALPTEEAPPPSVGELTGCVTRALASLFRVFAFVIFFSCISTCLLPIVTDCGLPELWGVLLCGLLEMTAGIDRAVTALAPAQALCVTALLAGFSGLSVCLQVFSITEGEGFPILPYLGARLTQGGIALLLCMEYLRLFSPTLAPTDSLAVFAQNPIGQRQLLGTSLLLVLLLFGASLQKRKKGGGRSRRR
ncbi:MAG: hypothetical protein IKM08_03815, partial [Clostridia bacterium]|nr:hypothetical protein [Clostridia bacterium]